MKHSQEQGLRKRARSRCKKQSQEQGLKRQCHEIFELYFFSLIGPIWAPDKQAKMVFLKN